jgi:hypothetical protein
LSERVFETVSECDQTIVNPNGPEDDDDNNGDENAKGDKCAHDDGV